jgi:cytochrome c-type biogenesis protein CcmI
MKIGWMPSLVLLIMLAASVAVAGPAMAFQAAPEGVIKGTLVNGTPGGGSVADQDINLQIYFNGQPQGQSSTKTDAQGKFEFTGLETSSQYSYSITVIYQGAEYNRGPLQFKAGETVLPWQVVVYDTTSDPSSIRVERAHLVIDFKDNSLIMLEFFSFNNSGNKTFIGSKEITPDGKKETLRFGLPQGATEITPNRGLMECCLVRTEGGISDTMPVEPGSKDVVFSYRLPYDSSRLSLTTPIYYPVGTLNLLVSAVGAKADSPQLDFLGPVDMGGQQFLHLAKNDLPAGTEITIELSELPRVSGLSATLTGATLPWVGALLALVAVGIALGYPFLRQRRVVPVQPAPREDSAGQEALLRELADLDDRFAAGQIEPEEYQRVRKEKKQKLLEALRRNEGKHLQ